MPVPDYQTVMLPLLQAIADGQEHTLAEVAEKIADQFGLSESERTEMLPSGGQLKLFNRTGWAKTYMAKAGLMETVSRGKFRITPRGTALLKSRLPKIDNSVLSQFPEFIRFRERVPTDKSTTNGANNAESIGSQQTPQESLENGFQALHGQLSEELLDKISKASPRFFEKLVVDLLLAMGYGGSRSDAGQAIGKSGDDGLDGIIKEDRLGLDAVYVQAKRWKSTVGRPEIQSFAGSLEGHRARKGVFITTSQFSADAKEYVNRIEKKIVLIDGDLLANLSIEFGIGVAPVTTYRVQKIDLDYFEEE
jgi:restriction system protein